MSPRTAVAAPAAEPGTDTCNWLPLSAMKTQICGPAGLAAYAEQMCGGPCVQHFATKVAGQMVMMHRCKDHQLSEDFLHSLRTAQTK